MDWRYTIALPCALLAFGLGPNESALRRFQAASPDSLVLSSAIDSDSSVRLIIPGFSATPNVEVRSRWRRITGDTLELSSPAVLVPIADTVQLKLLALSGGPSLSVAFSFITRSGYLARCTEVGRTFEINLGASDQRTKVAAIHGLRTCRRG